MKREKEPLYIQIYEHLKKEILQGSYPYGSKLPSRNVMAEEMHVSVITIKHTYELLCDEGYLESRERSGYYVIFCEGDGFAASEHENYVAKSYEFHREEYAFPFSVLSKTMRRVMSEYGEQILEKSENKGSERFRESIRKYLARNRNIHVDAEQIIVGSGAEYLYNLIAGLFGREMCFAIESPSYEKIEQVYGMAGIMYESLPLGKDGIESQALSNSKARVLHISPYRSFPTGITASASKRHEYIRWAAQKERFIIEDDFESEFSVSSKPEETMFSISELDNIIYMNTFTKTISPSLRVGYMVIPKKLVKRFDELLGFYSCTVPTFEQLVIADLIDTGDFERHINRVRRAKRREMSKKNEKYGEKD